MLFFEGLKLKFYLTCALVLTSKHHVSVRSIISFQDTLIYQRENMPYGDLNDRNVLLSIFNRPAANIYSACCCHTSCNPCTSTHPTLHVRQKGSAARQESIFCQTHPYRASEFAHWRLSRTDLEQADFKCTALQSIRCSVWTYEENFPKSVSLALSFSQRNIMFLYDL
jgi:hypothetical protein